MADQLGLPAHRHPAGRCLRRGRRPPVPQRRSPVGRPMTGAWTRQGPRPTTGGQVEGIVDKEVVGAIKAVAPHPSDPDIVYAGSVNGGVWRTRDARSARPTWDHLTDDQL